MESVPHFNSQGSNIDPRDIHMEAMARARRTTPEDRARVAAIFGRGSVPTPETTQPLEDLSPNTLPESKHIRVNPLEDTTEEIKMRYDDLKSLPPDELRKKIFPDSDRQQ